MHSVYSYVDSRFAKLDDSSVRTWSRRARRLDLLNRREREYVIDASRRRRRDDERVSFVAHRARLSRAFSDARARRRGRARWPRPCLAAGFRSRRLAIFDALEARVCADASERETDDRCVLILFPRAQCLIASSNVRFARTHGRSARSRRESPSAWMMMMTTPVTRVASLVMVT